MRETDILVLLYYSKILAPCLHVSHILYVYVTVTVVTQPHNVIGCVGGAAMLICVVDI